MTIVTLIIGGIFLNHVNKYIDWKFPALLREKTSEFVSVEELFVYASEYDPLTEKLWIICQCENLDNKWECNLEYGCASGQGWCQLIPSTVKYCEEKLGKKIDPQNDYDNWQCAWWLLVNEGDRHWEPSRHCWEKKITYK